MTETIVVTGSSLSKLQLDVYDVICEGWLLAGHSPTQAEIARALRCSSQAVQNAVKALTKAGHITWRKYVNRGTAPVDPHRRLFKEAPPPWDIPPRKVRLRYKPEDE